MDDPTASSGACDGGKHSKSRGLHDFDWLIEMVGSGLVLIVRLGVDDALWLILIEADFERNKTLFIFKGISHNVIPMLDITCRTGFPSNQRQEFFS